MERLSDEDSAARARLKVERVQVPKPSQQPAAAVSAPAHPVASPHPVASARAAAARPVEAAPEEAPAPAPAPAPKPAPTTMLAHRAPAPDNGRIDDLLKGAFTHAESPEEKAEAAPALPELGRDEIVAVMKDVRKEVKAGCKAGVRGVAIVRIEVGAKGNVSAATVEGPFAGKPAGACVEAAVKRVRFPASASTSFRYPFPLR